MAYIELQQLSNTEFKRLCGVSRNTSVEMVKVLRPHLQRQGQRGGQNKLSPEDQLLVALEKGARISHSVPHRSELGIARDNRGANYQKSRRPADSMWQIPITESTAVVPTRLGMESNGSGCGGNRRWDHTGGYLQCVWGASY